MLIRFRVKYFCALKCFDIQENESSKMLFSVKIRYILLLKFTGFRLIAVVTLRTK